MKSRVAVFAAVSVVVVLATTGYTVAALQDSQAQRSAAPSVPSLHPTQAPTTDTTDYIAFRHTGVDSEYGVVAVVPLDDPSGARAFTGVACDRVYVRQQGASCLTTDRGVATTYSSTWLGPDWKPERTAPLAGLPSRTRISPDATLVSSTSFVSGHSYLAVGFSTATEIHGADGTSFGNLEKFALIQDGETIDPTDRNVWGVTFAADDNTFYATVGTGAKTYLVRGDLGARRLTILTDHVECPSLSPDGTRIAFKQAGTVDGQPGWTPAVLDLATGERTVLSGETHNVDDQLEWLDDDTLLYGLARPDQPGVTDVWSMDTAADAVATLLIEQAWSPSVVR